GRGRGSARLRSGGGIRGRRRGPSRGLGLLSPAPSLRSRGSGRRLSALGFGGPGTRVESRGRVGGRTVKKGLVGRKGAGLNLVCKLGLTIQTNVRILLAWIRWRRSRPL